MATDGIGGNAAAQQSQSFSPFEQLNQAQDRGRGQGINQAGGNQQAQQGQADRGQVEAAGQDDGGARFNPSDERGQLLDIEV